MSNNIEINNVIKVTVDKQGKSCAMTCLVIDKAEDTLICLELSSAKLMTKDEKTNIEIKKSDSGLKFNSFVNVANPLSLDTTNNKITKYKMSIPEKDFNKIIKSFNQLENPEIKPLKPINEFEHMENMIMAQIDKFKTDPNAIKEFLQFQARFHQYSPRNTTLIYAQNPYATFVASYTDWKNKFKANIKRGQKSNIQVLRPYIQVYYIKDNKICDINKASNIDKEKIALGEYPTKENVSYHTINLFDISQTDFPKDQYPKLYDMGYKNIECEELYAIVKETCNELSIPVFEQDLKSIALNGFYSPSEHKIVINELLEDSLKINVLCHELSHAVLHSTVEAPTEILEFEAESLAVMLNSRFNLPISNESIGDIKDYYLQIEKNNPDNLKDVINKSFERLKKQYNFLSSTVQNKIINDYPQIYEKQLIKENNKDKGIDFKNELNTENTINNIDPIWSNLK